MSTPPSLPDDPNQPPPPHGQPPPPPPPPPLRQPGPPPAAAPPPPPPPPGHQPPHQGHPPAYGQPPAHGGYGQPPAPPQGQGQGPGYPPPQGRPPVQGQGYPPPQEQGYPPPHGQPPAPQGYGHSQGYPPPQGQGGYPQGQGYSGQQNPPPGQGGYYAQPVSQVPPHGGAPPQGAYSAGPQAMDKMVSAVKNVDWQQLGKDVKTFGQRFAVSDFAKIAPEPHEAAAVTGYQPRMSALIVWRRALLFLACVLGTLLVVKTSFDPHTFQAMMEKQNYDAMVKANPNATSADLDKFRESAKTAAADGVKQFGESNANVVDVLIGGLWVSTVVSLVFQFMAARSWREWRKSRKLALISVAALLIPQLLAMLIPWASLMDFKHLQTTPGDLTQVAMVKRGVQLMVFLMVLFLSVPFLYGLANGVLRASLSTKTLIPASIVCGWGSMLLAVTIAVPWYLVLGGTIQAESDALIILGALCLLGAPLSIIVKARRLGAPLTPEEASVLVKRTKIFLTGLNALGVLMILAWLSEKDMLDAMDVATMVVHYFANLMLVQVVAVDFLVLLLDRAHRKLAGDAAPGESLRQLGEVLPTA